MRVPLPRATRAQLANFLKIATLRELAGEFIAASLCAESVGAILEVALGVEDSALCNECMKVVSCNTEEVLNADGFDDAVSEGTVRRQRSVALKKHDFCALLSAMRGGKTLACYDARITCGSLRATQLAHIVACDNLNIASEMALFQVSAVGVSSFPTAPSGPPVRVLHARAHGEDVQHAARVRGRLANTVRGAGRGALGQAPRGIGRQARCA